MRFDGLGLVRAEIDLLLIAEGFVLLMRTFTELWQDDEVILSSPQGGIDNIDTDTFGEIHLCL